jgi:PAS domain S-box-containing protein
VTPEQFLVFAEPLPEPTLFLSGDGLILAGNQATTDRLGIPLQELRGQRLADVVADPPERTALYLRACSRSRTMVLGSLTLSRKGGEHVACRTEGAVVRPKGEGVEALLLLRLIPKESATGQFVALNQRIDELGKEIQRRKQAEEALRQQKERLRVTLASIGDAVIVTDDRGRVTFQNAVAAGLTGWGAEALGRELPEVFHIVKEQTGEAVESPASKVLKEGGVVGLANHTVLIARDGTRRPIDDSGAPIRDDDGKIVGVVLAFRDVSERRRSEQGLEAARERVQLVADAVPALISYIDADLRYRLNNRAYETWFGHPRGELQGRPMREVLGEQAWVAIRPHAEAALAGQVVSYEAEVPYREGGTRWISATYTPDVGQDGAVRGFVAHVHDITRRKRSEEAVQEQRELLRVTLASVGDGVMTTDLRGVVTFVNAVAESLIGWRNDEALGRPLEAVFQIVNEDSRQPVENPAMKALRESRVVGLANHTLLIARDGTERPIDDSAAPIKDEQGRVSGVVLIFRDVGERRRQENLLRQSEALYRATVEDNPAFICRFRADGTLTFVNNTYCRTFGKTQEELVGHRFSAPVPEADRPLIESLLANLHPEMPPYTHEHRVVLPGGEVRWQQWTNKAVVDAEGRFVEYQALGIDLTERKQVEASLQEADRRKDEFLATLAHELRNPLAPIRNGLQVIKLAGNNHQAVEQIRSMMERQLGQMVRLVDDLLDVSRITRNKLELRKERVELAAAVHSAVETSRPVMEEAGHELTVTLPPESVYVDADVTRLAQVFANLLNNAAKYTERGGRITLAVERLGSEVIVRVRDTGVGIPEAMLHKIFELFTQVDRSLEKAQGGLGIGLTIVKRLVEMHGGTVEARSDGHAQGSEFAVRLPVVRSVAAERTGQDHASSTACRRILVVDDNKDSAISLAMMLRIMGNETLTAHDGLEALDLAAVFKPHVVLLDIGMPKLNGYDTARRIRGQTWGKGMVLVAVTGWGQDEDKRQALEAGFDHHLVKPVDPAALEELLAGLSTETA